MSDAACPGLDAMDSAQFARRLRAKEHGAAWPAFTASMDWTRRCNLRCRHCFVRCAPAAGAELDTGGARRVLDNLADGGVLFLVITGGEPLLRPDFRALFEHAKRRGFLLTLFTNAVLVDDSLADFLAELPPRRVETTLYGAGAATYEAVTGVAGSFDRCRRGLDRLLRRGLLVRLKAMLLRANVHEFEAMRELAQRLGCDFRYDALIHPGLNGDPQPLAERLDPGQAIALQFADAGDRQQFADYYRQTRKLRPQRALFECGAGVRTLHVDAAGQAHPCMLWRADPYDLLHRALDAGWHRHLDAILSRPAPAGECAACPDRGLCNCCPPLGLLETGAAGRKAPYYCALAEARKKWLA